MDVIIFILQQQQQRTQEKKRKQQFCSCMSCCWVRVSIHWKIIKKECMNSVHNTDTYYWYRLILYLHILMLWVQNRNGTKLVLFHARTHTNTHRMQLIRRSISNNHMYWKKVYACATKLSFLNYFEWRREWWYITNWGSRSVCCISTQERACPLHVPIFNWQITSSEFMKKKLSAEEPTSKVKKKHLLPLFGAHFFLFSFILCTRTHTFAKNDIDEITVSAILVLCR